MTIHHIITDSDKDIDLLRAKCREFNFENPIDEPRKLAQDMIDTMYHNNGLGLAANQIGFLTRLFVMRGTEEKGNFAIFNPRIVDSSDEIVLLEESCLSFPGVIVKIKRPKHIRMRFEGPTGETFTEKFTGITARVVQHEIDHLNGILFFNRANKYYKDRAFKNRGKYVQKNQNFLTGPFLDKTEEANI